MTRLLVRFLALFALAWVAACNGEPPAPVADQGPALWRVQRGALDGWLFGTIHVLPKGVAWQTRAMQQAMDQADRLVLEASDIQDPRKTLALFEKMGRSPGLPPIEARVPPADRAALGRIMSAGGPDMQALSGYESWAAAMLLSSAMQQSLDISQDNGVEPALIRAFQGKGKAMEGLETVERQFGAFDALPEAAQRSLLVQTVHEAKDLRALYERILNAWMKGDMAAIAREEQIGERPDAMMRNAVLIARNRDWVKAIEPMTGRPFIAVGTGHLTGPDNLIDLLKARGFSVTRVQ